MRTRWHFPSWFLILMYWIAFGFVVGWCVGWIIWIRSTWRPHHEPAWSVLVAMAPAVIALVAVVFVLLRWVGLIGALKTALKKQGLPHRVREPVTTDLRETYPVATDEVDK